MPHYTCLWEFRVATARRAEFARVYGPRGDWAALFHRASGYLGTLLLHDVADPERFVTIDRWRSEADFRAFKATFAHEYADLDVRCEHLTLAESPLGSFEEA
jgi:heme-degrading monooxygenase HmoA